MPMLAINVRFRGNSAAEGQPFHLIADGVPAFERLPPRQ
jgi:hypothetical protein